MSRVKRAAFMLCVSCCLVWAQRAPLTDSDIVNMVKAGLSEQTIVLAIQQGPTAFDMSPDGLIKMKKDGVSESVLNAVLRSAYQSTAAPVVKDVAPDNSPSAVKALLESVLRSYGGRERVQSVKAMQWKGTDVHTTGSGRFETQESKITVLPGNAYFETRAPNGQASRAVVMPDAGYITTGSAAPVQMPAEQLAEWRRSFATNPVVILSNIDDGSYQPSIAGSEQIGNVKATILKFIVDGQEVRWSADPISGRLLRTVNIWPNKTDTTLDFSDWRNVDGLMVPFACRNTTNGQISELTITEYLVNPVIDSNLFQKPSTVSVAKGKDFPLTIKVVAAGQTKTNRANNNPSVTINNQACAGETVNCTNGDDSAQALGNAVGRMVVDTRNEMAVELNNSGSYITLGCTKAGGLITGRLTSSCRILLPGEYQARRRGKNKIEVLVDEKHTVAYEITGVVAQ